jgi:hypothetical protein
MQRHRSLIMLVENIFITTLDAGPTLDAANEYLTALGFQSAPSSEPQPPANTAQWSRGLKKLKHYVRISDLPQRARVDFDRGRVTFAISVEERGKEKPALHEGMLMSIATGIEQYIGGKPMTDALAVVDGPQAGIEKHFRRQRLIKWIILSIPITIFGLIAFGIIAALIKGR